MQLAVRTLGMCLALCAGLARADWIERSNEITMEVLRAQGRHQPETVAAYGLEEFDREVSSLAPGAREAALASNRVLIAGLETKLAAEKDPRLKQDIAILITALEDEITSSELHHELLIPYQNLHQNLFTSFQLLLDKRNDPGRYPAALARLKKYNGEADGYTPLTEQAIARASERFAVEGLVGPYVAELDNALEKAPHLLQGVENLLRDTGLEGWERDYQILAEQLGAYADWLDTEMRKHSRRDNRLPAAIYADNLKGFGVHATPEELIPVAQYSYQLLRSEMKAIAWRIAEQRGWKDRDLVSVIRALKREQLPADKVMPIYQQRLAALEAIIRREDIISLPDRPASIRLATEAEAAAIPAPFMSPPQLVGNTGQYGEFVLVQSNPALGDEAKMDDFTHDSMTWALTVHEARPGHELQFTRLVEDGTSLARAVYAFNSANVEGWGLYAESIMHEFLPLEGQLFNLYTRIMRAARMFLDPMVNTGQLSHQGARDFLIRELAMSLPMASSEADRYAFWAPGQATSYYYGYMGLSALRTEVELAQGEAFNQRAFHDFILQQGLLPPNLLREAVLDEFVR